MTQIQTQANDYPLGHAESELKRLMKQAELLDPLTEHVLIRAGLRSGMKVLDIGCGAGDVSLLAAKIVGSNGRVVGIDQSPEAIAISRSRLNGNRTHVSFIEQNLLDLQIENDFDAVVGRLVLMYMPDPAGFLRKISRFLKPDGLLVFHEIDCSYFPICIPSVPLFERSVSWIREAFWRSGAPLNMGLKLFEIFKDAGFGVPDITTGSFADGKEQSYVYDYVADTVRSLLPVIDRFGIASRSEIHIETLSERLRKDVLSAGAYLISPLFVGSWVRIGKIQF